MPSFTFPDEDEDVVKDVDEVGAETKKDDDQDFDESSTSPLQ